MSRKPIEKFNLKSLTFILYLLYVIPLYRQQRTNLPHCHVLNCFLPVLLTALDTEQLICPMCPNRVAGLLTYQLLPPFYRSH